MQLLYHFSCAPPASPAPGETSFLALDCLAEQSAATRCPGAPVCTGRIKTRGQKCERPKINAIGNALLQSAFILLCLCCLAVAFSRPRPLLTGLQVRLGSERLPRVHASAAHGLSDMIPAGEIMQPRSHAESILQRVMLKSHSNSAGEHSCHAHMHPGNVTCLVRQPPLMKDRFL